MGLGKEGTICGGKKRSRREKKTHVCNLNLLSYGSNETRHALKKHKLYSESHLDST